jgi:Fe-S-cluster-containing dehydrogenase component
MAAIEDLFEHPDAIGIGDKVYVIDQSRCIGCNACVQACSECDTHKGRSMMHLEAVDRSTSTQTAPMVCMHCDDPTCAEVCPADAIKKTEDGVVQSAEKSRCIGCSNCVIACPFGVPEYHEELDLMMKCDLCYDRTSVGSEPMCTSVCPSQALWYGTIEEFHATRPGTLANEFQFGNRLVSTRVHTVVHEPGPLDVLLGRTSDPSVVSDPFGLDEIGVPEVVR